MRKGRDGGNGGKKTGKKRKRLMEIVATTSLPAVDRSNADRPNADCPNADRPNADRPNADRPNADRPNRDRLF